MASGPDDPSASGSRRQERTTRVLAQVQAELDRSTEHLRAMRAALDKRRRARLPATGTAADVLIVEDDRDLALALEDLLAAHGYTVATVHDGADALAYLQEVGRPAAVVLDLMLPGVPGGAVVQQVRATPATPATEIIVYTAATDEYLAQRGIAPDSVVRKPHVPVLLDRLSACLGPAIRR
jgi:CheY-like chemotaxis protein